MKEPSYAGIDRFRMIAAFLVLAIHVSPLTSANATADFILARVVARVAVPFFFMVSGFFLFPKMGDAEAKKLLGYLGRMAALYAVAVLLYLPLNLYHGIPEKWTSLAGLLKDIFIDGTYLHLWYLPAAMTGAVVSWALLKFCKDKGALFIGVLLYAVGLLGDSYYGFAEKLPAVKAFYEAIFPVLGYTRNGLFLAPVFFIMGAWVSRRPRRIDTHTCMIGLGVSLILMLAEGLLLREERFQRHDSMYVMLLPCMYFLFQCLLMWEGQSKKSLRTISAAVYIIHPGVIMLVYKLAAWMNSPWLIGNSVVRFLVVSLTSLAAAIIITALLRIIHSKKTIPSRYTDRAWVEISLASLRHNALAIQKALPDGCSMIAVVKANAYGHGDIEVSKALNHVGVQAFAVATIGEGIRLRKAGVRGEILVMGYTEPARASELCRYRLSQTAADAQHAAELNGMGKKLKVHIKVDTGMHRLGESYDHAEEIAQVFGYCHLRVEGMFTHLCVCDSTKPEDIAFTRLQIKQFYCLLDELKRGRIAIPPIHIQSSYGVLNYPELRCDCARIGIALYGASEKAALDVDLQPVLSLKARVVLMRSIAAGESVGYGCEFIAKRDMRMAVLPVGYRDGLPRNLEGGCVLLKGCRAPIIGRICMDQLMIDVTDVPGVQRGDTATLIGRDGCDEISVPELAAKAGTIPNEVLSRLGSRLERVCR